MPSSGVYFLQLNMGKNTVHTTMQSMNHVQERTLVDTGKNSSIVVSYNNIYTFKHLLY